MGEDAGDGAGDDAADADAEAEITTSVMSDIEDAFLSSSSFLSEDMTISRVSVISPLSICYLFGFDERILPHFSRFCRTSIALTSFIEQSDAILSLIV